MNSSTLIEQAIVYLPADWRQALANGVELPERAEGAALFADISGFTPLAEALSQTLGLRQGAEELPRYLNMVYDSLVAEVDRYGGSVVGFAGDAVTCWFDELAGDAAARATAAARAAACSLAMQAAMRPFTSGQVPGLPPVPLGVKISIASGPARRFRAGQSGFRQMGLMAGKTLERMAAGEHLANRGEVIIDEATAHRLAGRASLGDWRESGLGDQHAVLVSLNEPVAGAPWPALPAGCPPLEQVRDWLLPAVFERLKMGMGEFLTELRPVSVLFLRFTGIDYEGDPQAGARLDGFLCSVQRTLASFDGVMLDVIIGDKGAYLYAAFGAPVAHEDDPHRAVSAALALRAMCDGLDCLHPVQIGIAQGTLRTGAYGGATRRTYGVLGDDVNLAARLMGRAAEGEILVSSRIYKAISVEGGLRSEGFSFEPRPPVQLKGKSEPLPVFAITGTQQRHAMRLQEPAYGLPMVGRQAELRQIESKLQQALQGHGQVVAVSGEAGLGKSRLVAEVIRLARRMNVTGYGGACQSSGTSTPYLVWGPIWRGLFELNPDAPLRRQIRNLEGMLEDWTPERVDGLPLLGPLLGLSIPENAFTEPLEPQFRRSALEALLLDCLKAVSQEQAGQDGALLLVLEDVHWIDPASNDLLEQLARAIVDLPVLILLAYRPTETQRRGDLRVRPLAHFTEIRLADLGPAEAEQAIRAKFAQMYPEWRGAVPRPLIERVSTQAQGNPFYAEELLNYLHDQDIDLREVDTLRILEMPSSLHSLVLSRIDHLTTHQQLTIKVAAVIGRLFRFSHLRGYYPELGDREPILSDLEALASLDLTPLEEPEPELAYLFRHIITHEVAYENLPLSTRLILHEQYALYIEQVVGDEVDAYLDQLAFHYDHSGNLLKRRAFLQRAGQAAARRYANAEAADYFTRALALLPPDDPALAPERYALLRNREKVLDMQGLREAQAKDLAELVELSAALDAQDAAGQGPTAQATHRLAVGLRQSHYCERTGDYKGASAAAEQVTRLARASGAPALQAEGLTAWGQALYRLGESAAAIEKFQAGIDLARAAGAQRVEAACLYGLSSVNYDMGQLHACMQAAEQALALYRALNDKPGEASALSNMGLCARDLNDPAEMRRYFEQALHIDRELGDRRGESVRLGNLGGGYFDQGDLESARQKFDQALTLSRQVGDQNSEAVWLTALGDAALYQMRLMEARTFYQQARSIFQAIGAQIWETVPWLNLCEIERKLGRYASAAQQAEPVLALTRSTRAAEKEIDCLILLAECARGQHALETARTYLDQVLVAAEQVHSPGYLGMVHYYRGCIAETDPRTQDEVEPFFHQAREQYRIYRASVPMAYDLEIEALAGLARVWIKREPQRALVAAEEILARIMASPNLLYAREPLLVYLTAYQVLEVLGRPQAREILEKARAMLQSWAALIPEEDLRQSFLTNVPVNAAILAASGS